MEWAHNPQEFDASTDLGIGSIEIEKVELPEETIRKFVKELRAICHGAKSSLDT
jgi:hypothetical protein